MPYTHKLALLFCGLLLICWGLHGSGQQSDVGLAALDEITVEPTNQDHPDSHGALAKKLRAAGLDVPEDALVRSLDNYITADPQAHKALKAGFDTTRRRKNKYKQNKSQQPIVVNIIQAAAPASKVVEEKKEADSDSDDDIGGDPKDVIKFASRLYHDEVDGNKQRARKDCKKLGLTLIAGGISLGFNLAQYFWPSK